LPAGLWKGTGLSLVLDLLASILSVGNSAHQIGEQKVETNVSQVFIAFDVSSPAVKEHAIKIINETLEDLHSSRQIGSSKIYYPGETSDRKRNEYLKEGIPLNPVQWKQLLEM